MMRSFAEENFQTDYYVCAEMPFRGSSCHVAASQLVCLGQLTGFCMIGVFTESFFPNRPCNCSYQFHLLKLSLGLYDAFCLYYRYL